MTQPSHEVDRKTMRRHSEEKSCTASSLPLTSDRRKAYCSWWKCLCSYKQTIFYPKVAFDEKICCIWITPTYCSPVLQPLTLVDCNFFNSKGLFNFDYIINTCAKTFLSEYMAGQNLFYARISWKTLYWYDLEVILIYCNTKNAISC